MSILLVIVPSVLQVISSYDSILMQGVLLLPGAHKVGVLLKELLFMVLEFTFHLVKNSSTKIRSQV